MRKFFVMITTILLVGVICLSSLFGCKLITVNNDRDMDQVIAKIKIDDAPTKTIYKSDVVLAYNNYITVNGDSGSTREELFSNVIESLIENTLLVQYSMKHFADKLNITGEDKWKVETYLDAEELLDCKYNAYIKIEELVDTFVKDKPEDKIGDSYTGTVRVAPTGAKVSAEIEDSRKQKYVDDFWAEIIAPKYNAYVKAINTLKENGLLGDYTYGDIETIEYYDQVLVAYQEGVLVEKFQEDIEKEARSIIGYDNIVAEYQRLYNLQAKDSPISFEGTLSGISAQAPVLYGQNGYGMVYHILLKADEDMTADLTKWKEDHKIAEGTSTYENSAYREYRKQLFADIKAQDQRTSWIESKYDFGVTTTAIDGYDKAFDGDYTLSKSQSLPFFGDVTHLNAQDADKDDYKARYRVDDVKKFSLAEILELINEYLYDGSATITSATDGGVYTASKVNDDYDNRVKELMFAFSTDDSETALNTYKGYEIKPDNNQWMEEFTKAGQELITKDEKTFMLVATDHGYHIMFFSEYFGNNYAFDTLEKYLNKEFKYSDYTGWENATWANQANSWEKEFNFMVDNYVDYENTDNFLYILYNKLASTYVADAYNIATEEIFEQYANDTSVVIKYENAYKDLVEA